MTKQETKSKEYKEPIKAKQQTNRGKENKA